MNYGSTDHFHKLNLGSEGFLDFEKGPAGPDSDHSSGRLNRKSRKSINYFPSGTKGKRLAI